MLIETVDRRLLLHQCQLENKQTCFNQTFWARKREKKNETHWATNYVKKSKTIGLVSVLGLVKYLENHLFVGYACFGDFVFFVVVFQNGIFISWNRQIDWELKSIFICVFIASNLDLSSRQFYAFLSIQLHFQNRISSEINFKLSSINLEKHSTTKNQFKLSTFTSFKMWFFCLFFVLLFKLNIFESMCLF